MIVFDHPDGQDGQTQLHTHTRRQGIKPVDSTAHNQEATTRNFLRFSHININTINTNCHPHRLRFRLTSDKRVQKYAQDKLPHLMPLYAVGI